LPATVLHLASLALGVGAPHWCALILCAYGNSAKNEIGQIRTAERGVKAELEAKEQLKNSFSRFLAENDPARKNEAGKDLIRAVFGKDAIAEDTIR
jgi:hypothetical protein